MRYKYTELLKTHKHVIQEINQVGHFDDSRLYVELPDSFNFQSEIKPTPVNVAVRITGMGDVVARIAQPIAKVIDKVAGTNIANCGGCKKRQEAMNKAIPL
jgi:hypothetical protein